MKRILKTTLKVMAVLTAIYAVTVTVLIALSPKLVPNNEDEDFDVSDIQHEEDL